MAEQCLLCGRPAPGFSAGPDQAGFNCEACGSYKVTGSTYPILATDKYRKEHYKLSGLTRAASDAGSPLLLRTDDLADLIKSAPVPRTPFDALDRLLLVIHDHMISLTGGVVLLASDFPLIFARNFEEFRDIVNLLTNVGWASVHWQSNQWACHLTLAGWKHVGELRRVGRSSNQAFVAMWFNPDLTPAWSEGFEPALRDAGYDPVRVDRVEHNAKIDDQIIVEIRRSGLVIADFTGDRGGVYYEAGFAQGLGLPVIFTVRKDDISRLHFDTRQYNHIAWESPGELRERLHLRVMATLGPGQKIDRTL